MQENGIMTEPCRLCPRSCRADRSRGKTGYCGMDGTLRLARAALHMWEEPCISGTRGSGTVFFTGCGLRCIYCQNREIALGRQGKAITVERLADIFLELEQKGAANINLVTGTQYVPQILTALEGAKARGMKLPVVYNTSGYERPEILRLLEGYVDIYLPDCKYMEASLAEAFSHAPDYPEVVKRALAEMFRQVGPPKLDAKGYARKGMIVRHLILPGHTTNSRKVLEYLYRTFGDDIMISIMNQYTPVYPQEKFPELNRRVTGREYNKVLDYAISLGIVNAYTQEGETAEESFIPEFDFEGV